MAKRKETVLEELQRVRLIGPSLADDLYTDHKVRTLEDLIALGEGGALTELKGVGKNKAATILSSARRLAVKKDAPQKPEPKATPSPKTKPKKKSPAAKAAPKPKPQATPEKAAEKLEAKKVEARKKEAPKKPEKQKSPSRGNGKMPEAPAAAPASPAAAAGPGLAAEPTRPTATPRRRLQERFIDVLRCPACGHDDFDFDASTLTCKACDRQFNLQDGIADLAPPQVPSRSITQKLMESRFYAQFYEEFMRPRLTGVVSDRSMREEYRLAAEFLDFGDDIRLLDVGCGTANFTRYFAQRIGLAEASSTDPDLPLVVGMDISWPMLENARRNIRQENLDGKVFLLRGDGTRIPIRRGGFNRLHCAGALHLMSDIDEGLRNFARVLEPDGVCVIGTFILGSGIFRRLLKRAAEFPTHFHWFSRDELHKRIERAGFEVLDDSVAGDAITIKARRI